MSRVKRYLPLILGIASALGLAWLIRKQHGSTGFPRIWQQVLNRLHGVEKAQVLATAAYQQHAALLASTPMPENKALRWHLTRNILPGLALYQVLLKEHEGDKPGALAEVEEAFRAWTTAKSRMLLAPLKVLPEPFRLFKLVFAQMMKQFPADGWDITYIANDNDKLAFNMTRCFYLNTLSALGAPELTALFCKGDDVMAEFFPPSISFVRHHTLGRGDDLCDFQYCRMKTP